MPEPLLRPDEEITIRTLGPENFIVINNQKEGDHVGSIENLTPVLKTAYEQGRLRIDTDLCSPITRILVRQALQLRNSLNEAASL